MDSAAPLQLISSCQSSRPTLAQSFGLTYIPRLDLVTPLPLIPTSTLLSHHALISAQSCEPTHIPRLDLDTQKPLASTLAPHLHLVPNLAQCHRLKHAGDVQSDQSSDEEPLANSLPPGILERAQRQKALRRTPPTIQMQEVTRQALPMMPPIWAKSRQEICETCPWFRSYQGGVYHSQGLAKGYLLGGFGSRYVMASIFVLGLGFNLFVAGTCSITMASW